MSRSLILCAAFIFFAATLQAQEWPAWRGPTGQGYCSEKDLPLTWSEKENVRWKHTEETPIDSRGLAIRMCIRVVVIPDFRVFFD